MGQPAETIDTTRKVQYLDVGDTPTDKAAEYLGKIQRKVGMGLGISPPSVDWVKDIAEMHDKFGVNPVIRTLDQDKLKQFLQFRIDFLQEELDELNAALNDPEFTKNRADETVDALIDLCVVAIGTLNAFDVDAYEAWSRVHEKNMQKNPGVNANRPNPLGLPDLIKPAGWTPPTHVDNVGLLSKVFDVK